MAEQQSDSDYGYSGRTRDEGDYSGAYGRGTAGETDTPSAGGSVGAGYSRGGADLPTPDRADGPVRGLEGDLNRDPNRDPNRSDDAADGGLTDDPAASRADDR